MKINFKSAVLAGILALVSCGSAFATDFFDSTLSIQGKTLDLGEAGRTEDYSVFVTNGTFSASDSFVGDSGTAGNIGVNGGPITLNNGSIISGNATLSTGSSCNLDGSSKITGSRLQGSTYNTKLTTGASSAGTFASTAASLSATANYTASSSLGSSVNLNNSSLTITAKDSNPVVLQLTNFSVSTGTFTLVGTAMTKYIIDVSQSFSLNNATIQLSGGLLAGNVVFNIEQGNANLTNSQMSGIIVATNAGASLNNSTVTGEIIAKVVNLNGGSKVKKPVKASP